MPLTNPQDVAAHNALDTGVHGVVSPNKVGYRPKVKLETRDMEAAAGDVSYTGYGFQPTGLIVIAHTNTIGISIGSSEPALAEHTLSDEAGAVKISNSLVNIGVDAVRQYASVKTYDADGFTLTWAKIGTPAAGTANLHVFAFR